MGAEESHLNVDQVPGFNPNVNALKKKKPAADRPVNERPKLTGRNKQAMNQAAQAQVPGQDVSVVETVVHPLCELSRRESELRC